MNTKFWLNPVLILTLLILGTISYANDGKKNLSVLVYTKNGKGYVHDNIAASVQCIEELGKESGFTVNVSDNPAIFNEKELVKYQAIIFTSTNNDVFDNDEQRLNFRRYIEAGGGFVGIHSVTGTERNWKWFKMMVGETFTWHAKFQSFSLINIDPTHPSMKDMPRIWTKEDECYFGKELYPVTNVLMTHRFVTLDSSQKDLIQKNAGTYVEYYPAVWYNEFQGGRAWISTIGHSKETYKDPVYKNHLLQGIKFVISQYKGIDFKKASSQHRDDELKN